MRLLKVDLNFALDGDETTLAEGLRALAAYLESSPPDLADHPGVSTGHSHHSFVWNHRLGARVTGKAAVFELRNGGFWVRVDDVKKDTFLVK